MIDDLKGLLSQVKKKGAEEAIVATIPPIPKVLRDSSKVDAIDSYNNAIKDLAGLPQCKLITSYIFL
jgi:hypothetical protein